MYRTIEQINQEYEGHWVCIINCDKDEYDFIAGGEVIFYSKDKSKIIRDIKSYRFNDGLSYFFYAREMPDSMRPVLLINPETSKP